MFETVCGYIVIAAITLILVSVAVLAIFLCVDLGRMMVEDMREDREKRNRKNDSDLPRLW